MAENESSSETKSVSRAFPLQHTASLVNQRLGLYLSVEQQKGLATGLLIGAALAGGVLAWTIAEALSDR